MKLFKTILSVALAACLMLALFSPALAAGFSDIENHWGRESIEQAVSLGLFDGVSEDRFDPNGGMTRGMFVTVLSRVAKNAGLDVAATQDCAFTDVPANAYYAPFVAWANEKGLVDGVSAERFDPDAPVTREQMCVILIRFFDLLGMDTSKLEGEAVQFLDEADISSWAKDAVAAVSRIGIIQGSDAEGGVVFKPAASATRAEVATVFVRQVTVMESLDQTEDPSEEEPSEEDSGSSGGGSGDSGGGSGDSGSSGDGGSGGSDPEEYPDAETEAEATRIAGYLTTMVENYKPGTDAYTHWSAADKVVQDCMDVLMDCIENALGQYNSGRVLSREFVLNTYETQIQYVRDTYNSLNDDQLTQINNIVVRLEEDSEHIYDVMDFFGVDY